MESCMLFICVACLDIQFKVLYEWIICICGAVNNSSVHSVEPIFKLLTIKQVHDTSMMIDGSVDVEKLFSDSGF